MMAMDDKGQQRLGIIIIVGIALVAGYILYAFPKGRCAGLTKYAAFECLKSDHQGK
jgi:hypothetical protein